MLSLRNKRATPTHNLATASTLTHDSTSSSNESVTPPQLPAPQLPMPLKNTRAMEDCITKKRGRSLQNKACDILTVSIVVSFSLTILGLVARVLIHGFRKWIRSENFKTHDEELPMYFTILAAVIIPYPIRIRGDYDLIRRCFEWVKEKAWIGVTASAMVQSVMSLISWGPMLILWSLTALPVMEGILWVSKEWPNIRAWKRGTDLCVRNMVLLAIARLLLFPRKRKARRMADEEEARYVEQWREKELSERVRISREELPDLYAEPWYGKRRGCQGRGW